jgi:hypothetical protein
MKELLIVIGSVFLARGITLLIPGPMTWDALVYQIFFTVFLLMWQAKSYECKNKDDFK